MGVWRGLRCCRIKFPFPRILRMRRNSSCLAGLLGPVLSFLLMSPVIAQSSVDAPAGETPPPVELETVLVTGEQPGPGLWKVSKGDHVLWILGTHQPLPGNMTWQSREVEARVAESREVIFPGQVKVRMNEKWLSRLAGAPAAPNGSAGEKPGLKDFLPSEAWDKWLVMKRKYIGKDERADSMRPAFAATFLQQAALRRSGLGNSVDVTEVVSNAAKSHRRSIRTLPAVTSRLRLDKSLAREFPPVEAAEIACFERTSISWSRNSRPAGRGPMPGRAGTCRHCSTCADRSRAGTA